MRSRPIQARGVLIIPPNFGRDIARGVSTPVQILVDGSDSNTAQLISGDASRLRRPITSASPAPRSPQPVQASIRLWYNPGRSSKKFYGPGIFVLGLSMFPPLLASLAMAKEGEQKTILQVYVSSISAHEFLLGKIFAFMVGGNRRMPADAGAAVHLFRLEPRRRSDAVSGGHDACTRSAWRRLGSWWARRFPAKRRRCKRWLWADSCWSFCSPA